MSRARLKFNVLISAAACLLALSACAADNTLTSVELMEPVGVTFDTFVVRREDFAVVGKYAALVVCHNEPLFFTRGGMPVKSVEAVIGANVSEGDRLVSLDTKAVDKQIEQARERIADMEIKNGFNNAMKEIDLDLASIELSEARRGGNAAEILRREYALDRLLLESAQMLESQEMELNRQYALLNDLYARLEDTVIYAPFDGRVVYIQTQKHNWPQEYKPVIYLADENRLQVMYTGRESLARTGRVVARIGEKEYDLEYIPLAMDEYFRYVLSGGTPPSRYEILGDISDVKPGQFAELSVITREEPNAVVIPGNAVFRGETGESPYVYVMENGTRVPRTVQLGMSNDSFTIVLDGLEEGEEVFVKQ